MESPDDDHGGVSTLLEKAKNADSSALESLLGCYRGYLRALAQSRLTGQLRAKADASDLAQEAILQAFESFGQFRGTREAELTAWLRRILARRLSLLVRRYRGTAARDLDRERALVAALDESSIALEGLVVAPGHSPSEAAESRERSVVLADALSKLAEDHRRVVVLRNLRQLSWNEIAEEMGRSPDALRMLWVRALRHLRTLIAGRRL